MFKADLKSDTLKGLVNIISTLIDEVKFTITADGMTLKAVDAAHVAMIEMEVGKGAFESYEAEACEIGTRLAASVICTSENVCPRFLPSEFGIDPSGLEREQLSLEL